MFDKFLLFLYLKNKNYFNNNRLNIKNYNVRKPIFPTNAVNLRIRFLNGDKTYF